MRAHRRDSGDARSKIRCLADIWQPKGYYDPHAQGRTADVAAVPMDQCASAPCPDASATQPRTGRLPLDNPLALLHL